ncbi:MAG: hypothetical protein KF747_15180 [Nitrospira sp.]|nr:hypothetical protein [Nitrospira sp.]
MNKSLRFPLRTHGMQSIVRTDDRQQERIILKRLAQLFKDGYTTDNSLIRKVGWIR